MHDKITARVLEVLTFGKKKLALYDSPIAMPTRESSVTLCRAADATLIHPRIQGSAFSPSAEKDGQSCIGDW